MIGIPFSFQFDGKFYSGMFQKIPAIGTETEKLQIFDIDPKDYHLEEPFYLTRNYENDNFSFPVEPDHNKEYLEVIVHAVLSECEKQGEDRF